MKKWVAIILVLVLVIGGGTYWYMGKKAKAKQASNIYIPTSVVQKGTLESDVSGSGSLTSAIDEDVTAAASETVYAINVSVGENVKKGQEILEYNNGTYLDAPDNGTVTSLSVYTNSQVRPGQAVAHITNYTNLDTVVSVDELDIPNVKIGQPVDVTVNAYPNSKFTGKVTKIADTGTDTNGVSSFDVTVHLDSSKNLKPGMTTSANIVTSKKANALYVPIGAIHKQGSTTYVLVDSGNSANQVSTTSNNSNYGGMSSRKQWRKMGASTGNAQMVTVKTGLNNDTDIEILSGLKEGEVVQLPPIVRNSSTSSTTNGNGFGMYGGGGFGGGFGGGYGGRGLGKMSRSGNSNSGNNNSGNSNSGNNGGGN
jgi:multidrug efflux pump subunit AcrA (membrane-fusion protein)